MARGRKPKIRPALLTDPNMIKRIDAELRDAEQERDDAAMSVAGQYKAAEKQGVHREAFKRARRYAKMSREKFADEWRALQIYVPILCADHLAQPDLLEQAAASDGAEEEMPDEPLPFGDGEAEDAPEAEGEVADADEAAAEIGEEETEATGSDWGDLAASATDEDLAAGGYAFNAGRTAGRNGEEPSTNPHPLDGTLHALWAKGYAQGLDEGPEEAAPQAEDEPAPRRRRATRAAAVVH